MLRARARRAQPEDINDVMWLRKSVLAGNVFGPLLDGIRLDFDRRAALAANQMVMMGIGRARAEQTLTILLQRVRIARAGQIRQRSVHRGQAYRTAGITKRTVQGLSAHETL